MVAGNPALTEDGQQDVDEQVGAAAALEGYTNRREDDGQDDLENIATKDGLAIDRPQMSSRVPLAEVSGRRRVLTFR